MRKTAPIILLGIALLTALMCLFGDDSFSKLKSLQYSLQEQKRINAKLGDSNDKMRREIEGLQNDPRSIEKVARGKLGMAKSDEVIVIFDKDKTGSQTALPPQDRE